MYFNEQNELCHFKFLPQNPLQCQKIDFWGVLNVQVHNFFWERNQSHFPNSHPKFWSPWNVTIKLIPYCTVFSFRLITFVWTGIFLKYFDFTDIVWAIKDFNFLLCEFAGFVFCSILIKSHLYLWNNSSFGTSNLWSN